MRQTSRAVALLLAAESAQAATATLTTQVPAITTKHFYFTTVFYPDTSEASSPSTSMQLNSRTAGYTWNQQVFDATTAVNPSMQLDAVNYQLASAGTTYKNSKAAGGSSCVQCIGGGGVWCSRTFSYLETAAVDGTTQHDYNYALTDVSTSLMSILLTANFQAGTEEGTQTGQSKDQGSCCNSKLLFQNFIGNQAALSPPDELDNVKPTPDDKGIVFVDAACVALKPKTAPSDADLTLAAANAWGIMQIDDGLVRYSSWWCSNGLYKKIYLNNSSVATLEVNSQQIIGNGINKRMELSLIGCPQKTLMCGTGTSKSIVSALTTSAVTITVDKALLTLTDKCTWVAQAFVAAPTFKFGLATAPDTGITSSNWQIHAMEFAATAVNTLYTAEGGALETAQTDSDKVGYQSLTSAVTNGTYIPKFNMPADQFATLRTWYGEAISNVGLNTVADLPAAWLTPGQAPVTNALIASQQLATVTSTEQYGNVVNVPFSKISTQTGALATNTVGDSNFGPRDSAQFDLRQARYFPAQVAQTVHSAGSDQAAKYKTATDNYATAKTAWDNYVAILEKNAKTDAFAALFSPPKSPTVPPLPSLPWVPATYAGYVRATAAELQIYNKSYTTSAFTTTTNPTAQQFWNNLTSAQTVGGWGSFTAQVLRYRSGWGKSFGTIGYSGAATNSMSAVWNYKWTCTAASTSAPGTTPCDGTYSGVIGTQVAGPTVTNTVSMVSVVSLWSTANKETSGGGFADVPAYAFSGQSFSLIWTPQTWSGSLVALKAIDAPVAATAAKGLSGVAGAQALAATSAAALAVAAALY